MADCNSSASVISHSDCDENRSLNPNYSEIIVIRHGETEWNSSRRIQGQLDVDLNDVGRKQAYAVADRMSREPNISAVYSSDSRRAFDTAEIIAKGCGVLEVIKDPGLRERHLGDLQGLVFQEIAKINPVAYKAFLSNDQEIPGGGESFNQAYERCTLALERIAKKHIGERVIIVSHGGSIESLLVRASPRIHELIKAKIQNTSVNVLHICEKGEWSLKSWGDVSHLNQTGFLQTGFGGDRNSG